MEAEIDTNPAFIIKVYWTLFLMLAITVGYYFAYNP